MPKHRELAALRRRIWWRLETSVRELVGPPSADLRRYERRYHKALERDDAAPVLLQEVLERAVAADLVLCGDYHTFRPAQATCLRLLETLASRTPRVVLLVELALTAHQGHLDRWLAGEIDEHGLLRALDYRRTWGFAWSGYRPLFEYARENGIPIRGINGPGNALRATLEDRDRWAAEVIAGTMQEMPGAKLLVLAGDLHVARPHLPQAMRRALAARHLPARALSVFQNADHLYWRLASAGCESEAVRLEEDAYCVFSGTPWTKLESYLSWLEWGEEPATEPSLTGEGLPDYTDRILELLEALGRFLGIATDGADAFAVHTADDLSFVAELERDTATRHLIPHVLASDVFLLPTLPAVYLARLDLGHAAEGAAEILLQLHTPVRAEEPLAGEAAFFRRVQRKALARLGSKLLNPDRRPHAIAGKRPQAAALLDGWSDLVRNAIEEGLDTALPAGAVEDDVRLGLALSSAVGADLGERLYAAFRDGELERAEIRGLYRRGTPGTHEARRAVTHLYGVAAGAMAAETVA